MATTATAWTEWEKAHACGVTLGHLATLSAVRKRAENMRGLSMSERLFLSAIIGDLTQVSRDEIAPDFEPQ